VTEDRHRKPRTLRLREAFGVTVPEPAPTSLSAIEKEIERIVKRRSPAARVLDGVYGSAKIVIGLGEVKLSLTRTAVRGIGEPGFSVNLG